MSRQQSRYVRVNQSNPSAAAVCDLCGRWYNHFDLQWNMQWGGTKLFNTWSLRCRECLDTPQEQLRSVVLPPDPEPILNARVPDFSYEEQTVLIAQFGGVQRPPSSAGRPPWGAGPQLILCDQTGEVPLILQYLTSS